MPLLFFGAAAVSAVFYTGGEAAEKTTNLTKWAILGGSIYLLAEYKKVI